MQLHIRNNTRDPLVIWGPTGCGKTCGVRVLFEALQYRIVELDGAEADDTRQLVTWITRTRDAKNMLPTALLIDDFESFTPDARSAVVRHLKSTPGDSPVIVTCTQLRQPDMKGLTGFRDIRLYAPNEHVCEEWFRRCGVRIGRWDGSSWTIVRHVPTNYRAPPSGDIRQQRIRLEWEATTGKRLGVEAALFQNAFDAVRRLLLRKVSPTRWAAGAEPRDASLVQEHLPPHVPRMDDLASALESLSVADALRPQRFECSAAAQPLALQLVGLTVVSFSKARDVGALPPRARGETSSDRIPDTPSGARPTTRMEWLETPALLRDRS